MDFAEIDKFYICQGLQMPLSQAKSLSNGERQEIMMPVALSIQSTPYGISLHVLCAVRGMSATSPHYHNTGVPRKVFPLISSRMNR
jgi:hypothetical protein